MALANYYSKPAEVFFPDDQWKVSFSLAVVLHILVLLLTLLPSSFFRAKVEMPEVVTINLFNVEELKVPKPKAIVRKVVRKIQPKPLPKPKTLPPPPKAVSIAHEPTPPAPVPALPGKVISLKPRTMKKKMHVPKKQKNRVLDAKLLNAVARIRAQKKQELAQEKAKDALARLRDQLHIAPPAPAAPESQAQPDIPSQEQAAGSEAASGSDNSSVLKDKALNRYYLAVSRKIHEHWVLPEMQKWDDSLESIFVVVVKRNGVIKRKFFEKRSGNSFFNQFVEKTILEAEPMPHFPADIRDDILELGLIFHPSGLL